MTREGNDTWPNADILVSACCALIVIMALFGIESEINGSCAGHPSIPIP